MQNELLDRIDAYLLDREEGSRAKTAHWASDASACPRQLFYKWTGEPKSNPITAGALWKMKIGNGIHELIHGFLKESGLEIIDEVALKIPADIAGLAHDISGRMDNLFEDPDSGDLEIIEAKTSFGYGIRSIRENGPKPEHLVQLVIYLRWAGVKRGHLVYVARDDGYRTEFIVDYDREKDEVRVWQGGTYKIAALTYAWIHERLLAVEKAVDSGLIPARPYWQAIKNGEYRDDFQKDKVKYKSDWQCSYCAFRDTCWAPILAHYQTGDNLDMRPEGQGGGDD